jgi:hypothetical protein
MVGRATVVPPASLWDAFGSSTAVLTIGERSGDIIIIDYGEKVGANRFRRPAVLSRAVSAAEQAQRGRADDSLGRFPLDAVLAGQGFEVIDLSEVERAGRR